MSPCRRLLEEAWLQNISSSGYWEFLFYFCQCTLSGYGQTIRKVFGAWLSCISGISNQQPFWARETLKL